MAILAADKDKEIKTLFLKYMAWNMLPLLYNDALKKLCKMGFSLAKATKLLKSMQENGEIEIVSNLHYFGNKRCRLLPGILEKAQALGLQFCKDNFPISGIYG